MAQGYWMSASMLVAAELLAFWTIAANAEAAKPVFPDPPRLATTQSELDAEKSRVGFVAKRAAAIEAAGLLIANPVTLPAGPGSWIFYYACPDDGSTLRMLALDEHQCPKCKKKYSDERTAAAYRCQMHHDLEHAAVKLGWAFAYTGDGKYAAGVR